MLIVAEHASARLGGEAILPWHYFRLLRARGVDVHLVVHERTRAELEEAFPADRERMHFVRDRALQRLFFRLGKRLPRRLDEVSLGLLNQCLTQRAQRGVVRGLVVPGTVVHQPMPVAPKYPSLLYGVGAPVVVGPLNGGMQYPPAFRAASGLLERSVVRLGRALSNLAHAVAPGKRRAAVVLVANARTAAALPTGLRGRVVELVENGVDEQQWRDNLSAGDSPTQPGPFLFLGRLVDWKALDLVLEALVRVPTARLDVVGDGPMLEPWRALAATLGVAARVRFLGWQTQPACAEALRGCRALLLPSLYECGGAVVLEAMAMARPVIATAWGGPADYLDDRSGILVPPTSREALVAGFAAAMERLDADPGLARSMGRAGREQMLLRFAWGRKIDIVLDLYRDALRQPAR